MTRLLVLLILCASCARAEKLSVREYDAGAFILRYTAMSKVDPVFTHISRSLVDREDGAVYITSDPPRGMFGTKPGRGFCIWVLPAERFELSRSDLASSLPPKLKTNHPREAFSAHVRDIALRQWCEVISYEADSLNAVTGVSYYSFADSKHLIYAGWSYPRPVSRAQFAKEERARLEVLRGFEVRRNEPNSGSAAPRQPVGSEQRGPA